MFDLDNIVRVEFKHLPKIQLLVSE